MRIATTIIYAGHAAGFLESVRDVVEGAILRQNRQPMAGHVGALEAWQTGLNQAIRREGVDVAPLRLRIQEAKI